MKKEETADKMENKDKTVKKEKGGSPSFFTVKKESLIFYNEHIGIFSRKKGVLLTRKMENLIYLAIKTE